MHWNRCGSWSTATGVVESRESSEPRSATYASTSERLGTEDKFRVRGNVKVARAEDRYKRAISKTARLKTKTTKITKSFVPTLQRSSNVLQLLHHIVFSDPLQPQSNAYLLLS